MLASWPRSIGPYGKIVVRPLAQQLGAGQVDAGLGGSCGTRSEIDYPSFVYRPAGWKTRPAADECTSSMVSELAPVALYLRHIVQPGRHAHHRRAGVPPAPGNAGRVREAAGRGGEGRHPHHDHHPQRVGAGRVANLVLMSELPVEHRAGIEGADLALTSDEVGAWFFEPDYERGGSVVKEIPLDKEMGKFPSEFGLVTAELYNRFAKISNRIERLTEG